MMVQQQRLQQQQRMQQQAGMGGMQAGMRNMTMQGMQRPGQPVYNAQGQPVPAPRQMSQGAQQMQQGTQQMTGNTARSISGSAQPPQVSAIFAALYDYEAQNDDQMSFMKGDQISAVFTSGQVDWYQATSVSDPSITGWVPSNYLVELKAAITSQAPPQRQVPIAPGAQPRGFDQRPGHLQQSAFHQGSDSSISTNSGTNSVNNSGVFPPDTFTGVLQQNLYDASDTRMGSGLRVDSGVRVGSGGSPYRAMEDYEWCVARQDAVVCRCGPHCERQP